MEMVDPPPGLGQCNAMGVGAEAFIIPIASFHGITDEEADGGLIVHSKVDEGIVRGGRMSATILARFYRNSPFLIGCKGERGEKEIRADWIRTSDHTPPRRVRYHCATARIRARVVLRGRVSRKSRACGHSRGLT